MWQESQTGKNMNVKKAYILVVHKFDVFGETAVFNRIIEGNEKECIIEQLEGQSLE